MDITGSRCLKAYINHILMRSGISSVQNIKFIHVLWRLISRYSNYYLHSTDTCQHSFPKSFLVMFILTTWKWDITDDLWRISRAIISQVVSLNTQCNYGNGITRRVIVFTSCNKKIFNLSNYSIFRTIFFSWVVMLLLFYKELETYNIVLARFLWELYVLTFSWALIFLWLGGTKPWCRFYFLA